MNIYSWNVNGLRSAIKKGFEEWFNATSPDILCLQEVRADEDQVPESIRNREGYFSYWNPCRRKKGYSGVAIFTQIEPDSVNYGFDIEEFDEEGRVTLDPYGDVYEYDERGYFIYGGTDELIRDDDTGRIMSYDNTIYEEGDGEYPDYDIETYFRIRFEYDAAGRPVTEEMYGWEWGTTYTNVFEGKKVYPASATFEGGYEGIEEKGTVKYDYSAFDRRGNWTERTVTTVTQSWEEGREDEVETLTEERLERRTIKYWSDKE